MNVFDHVEERIRAALAAVQAAGGLPADLAVGEIDVEPVKDAKHGDIASNIAMVLAKPARMKPRDNVFQGGGAATTDPRRPDYDNLYVMKDVEWNDPTVAELARERGQHPVEVMIDLSLANDNQVYVQPLVNERPEQILGMLRHPRTLAEGEVVRSILAEHRPDSKFLAAQLESSTTLVLFDLKRYAEAAASARRGLEVAEDQMPDAEVTNFLRICLADALALSGETDEALAIARRAVEVQHAAPGADPLFATMTEQTLGTVLLEAGRVDEAVVQLPLRARFE